MSRSAPLRVVLGAVIAAVSPLAVVCLPAAAADSAVEDFAVHGQFTYTEQETSRFRAPYSGPNSLTPAKGAETTDLTLFLGRRLWTGAELWFSAEVDQGRGLDDTLGVAGFPSGEAYKVGDNQPYLRLTRLIIRQSFDLGGDLTPAGADPLQLGGTSQSSDRVVVTLGKFAVTDLFDGNQYAHDPRADFLNWAIIDTGTFDYAADSWGYTAGATIEWYQDAWVARVGLFDLSDIPNSPDLEPAFHEFQNIVEIERDQKICGHGGKIRLTAFESRGRMGLLDQALAIAEATQLPIDIARVRHYRTRLGAGLDVEQDITAALGLFIRAGKAQGNVEPYEFTDIDRTVAAGGAMQGTSWGRADDTAAIAGVLNGISAAREEYLNAGGLGVLIGDGRLTRPGTEKIVEAYYSLAVLRGAHLTFDYQFITNPGYNHDRGPVSAFAVRVHAQL